MSKTACETRAFSEQISIPRLLPVHSHAQYPTMLLGLGFIVPFLVCKNMDEAGTEHDIRQADKLEQTAGLHRTMQPKDLSKRAYEPTSKSLLSLILNTKAARACSSNDTAPFSCREIPLFGAEGVKWIHSDLLGRAPSETKIDIALVGTSLGAGSAHGVSIKTVGAQVSRAVV